MFITSICQCATARGRPCRLVGGYNCPKGYPVKGDRSSKGEKIYDVPTGAYYRETKPEFCFRSENDAERAGFRRSLW